MAGKGKNKRTIKRKQHITRVMAKNFMGLEFAEFRPRRGVIKIIGKNDQGKTSLMIFIRAVLGGKYEFPEKTVREGSTEAEGEIETEDFHIKWSYRDGDKSPSLVVRDKELGGTVKGPQTFIRRLFGTFALDLLRFYDMEPRQQLEYCNRVMVDENGDPIDLEEYETEKDALEKDRREKRRARDDAQAVLDKYPPVEDPPEEPVDVTALSEEIEAAITHNNAVETAKAGAEAALKRVEYASEFVKELERQLEEAKNDLEAAEEEHVKLSKKAKSMKAEDVDALKKKRADASETNGLYEDHMNHVEARKEYEKWTNAFDAVQEALDKLIDGHRERMEKAKSPVVGLQWAGNMFIYNGIPLNQNSMRNKIFVAWQLSIAENPDMPVALIDDGNVLDEDAQELFEKLSKEHDADTIMVLVGENVEGAQLVIRDGKGVEPTEKD